MSTKKESTAVVVIGSTVIDALKAIKKELKDLQQISETAYKTGGDGKVPGFPNSIQTETSVEQLIMMHSSVYGRSNAYDASQERLTKVAKVDIVAPPFRVNGATLDAIEEDIALRIKVLNISKRKNFLEELLKEGESYMTKEMQFGLYQQKLASALGLAPAEGAAEAEEA